MYSLSAHPEAENTSGRRDEERPIRTPTSCFLKVSKACEECRKRKIRCNGVTPCMPCQQRGAACNFRERNRRRRSRREILQDKDRSLPLQISDPVEERPEETDIPPENRSQQQSILYRFHSSVLAIHHSSQSDVMQAYYGPTSDFCMLQHLYRDLYRQPTSTVSTGSTVEEAGDGLDLLRLRHIFFSLPMLGGDAADRTFDRRRGSWFLPYTLAKDLLRRFLETHYNVLPFASKQTYEELLQRMYSADFEVESSETQRLILVMSMALAALDTDHWQWGEILGKQVKTARHEADLEAAVNLEHIQLEMLMISYSGLSHPPMMLTYSGKVHALFEAESGRPHASYLYIGVAARKAFAAGLHKESPPNSGDVPDKEQDRRVTFCALYFCETYLSFFLGRPSSMSGADIDIALPNDPFLTRLFQFAQVMAKLVQQVYRPKHLSLPMMWKAAISIRREMYTLNTRTQRDFGLDLENPSATDPKGIRETILVSLYNYITLITFRPFVIFRGKWKDQGKLGVATITPPWLNNACNHSLNAARALIYHLRENVAPDPLAKELRYNLFYLENSLFVLVYDFVHDEAVIPIHLPWVHSGLQFLSGMRVGEPVSSIMDAIRRILRRINPSYDLPSETEPPRTEFFPDIVAQHPPRKNETSTLSHADLWDRGNFSPTAPFLDSQDIDPDFNIPMVDFDYNFSAIDLETFFSYVPSAR
ncbi:hypothetical protein N7510_007137 [Penicillium lagena]|uniref:uncharacterized protein n=1 Tax=Penicillium lagena TaxID=94218 RepID=UPI002541AD03|nr:uncharacterized protein N7510_007137 [Penicillium lagena]KAJ5610418.1 hypothetical protein N7510_007137 [Penicillium lagena]